MFPVRYKKTQIEYIKYITNLIEINVETSIFGEKKKGYF